MEKAAVYDTFETRSAQDQGKTLGTCFTGGGPTYQIQPFMTRQAERPIICSRLGRGREHEGQINIAHLKGRSDGRKKNKKQTDWLKSRQFIRMSRNWMRAKCLDFNISKYHIKSFVSNVRRTFPYNTYRFGFEQLKRIWNIWKNGVQRFRIWQQNNTEIYSRNFNKKLPLVSLLSRKNIKICISFTTFLKSQITKMWERCFNSFYQIMFLYILFWLSSH